jgi:hypothetical protein
MSASILTNGHDARNLIRGTPTSARDAIDCVRRPGLPQDKPLLLDDRVRTVPRPQTGVVDCDAQLIGSFQPWSITTDRAPEGGWHRQGPLREHFQVGADGAASSLPAANPHGGLIPNLSEVLLIISVVVKKQYPA